jgi:DNA polymerase III epsilon subunit-like protein
MRPPSLEEGLVLYYNREPTMTDQPRIFVMDCETTGLKQPIQIVEVAWLELDENLKIIPDTAESYIVNPGRFIEPSASGVHGIRDKDITDDLPVAADLTWPEGEIILVAHNIIYDRPLLEPHVNIIDGICTMNLARRMLPKAQNHKLPTLSAYCELPRTLPHRAHGDILATAHLLEYIAIGANMNAGELLYYSKKRIMFKKMPWGMWKGTEMKYVPKDYFEHINGFDDLDANMRATVDYWLKKKRGGIV